MTRRVALVLLDPRTPSQPPPGVRASAWRAALAEDVAELAAGLAGVDSGVVATEAETPWAAELAWPGSVLTVAEVTASAAFGAAAGHDEVALLAADAPDLPALHVGKLFRALGSHPVAVVPAPDGGAVAVAARLPLPAWAVAAEPGMEPDAVTRLRAAAPHRGAVASAPGWHRLRVPADVHLLDPGLEGWEATRALLSVSSG